MNLSEIYKKSFKKKWVVRLKTKHPDGDNFDGVVLKDCKNYIILQQEEGFEFDGLLILPKKVIKGFRDSKYEECCNKIVRYNKSIHKIKLPVWLAKCENIEQIIKELQKRNIWPGVETIFDINKDSAFYVGPITEAHDKNFTIHCYDAAGKWEKEYELELNEIFKIEINSAYIKNFNQFMRK